MLIDDVYKNWLRDVYGYKLRSDSPIASVSLISDVGGGSSDLGDPDFSTFAGCEIWSASVDYEDGDYDCVSLWDSNPVYTIIQYCKDKGIEIEFPDPSPPSEEERLEAHIRSA